MTQADTTTLPPLPDILPLPPSGEYRVWTLPLTWNPNFQPAPDDSPPVFRWGRALLFARLQGTTWPDDGTLMWQLCKTVGGQNGVFIVLNPKAGTIEVRCGQSGQTLGTGAGEANIFAQAPSILPWDFSKGYVLLEVLLDTASLEVFTAEGAAATNAIYPAHSQIFCDVLFPQRGQPGGLQPTGDPVQMGYNFYHTIKPDPRTWLSGSFGGGPVGATATVTEYLEDGSSFDFTLPLIAGQDGDGVQSIATTVINGQLTTTVKTTQGATLSSQPVALPSATSIVSVTSTATVTTNPQLTKTFTTLTSTPDCGKS